MSVSHGQVQDIAALARLRLTDAEAELFATQLTSILDHMADLAEVAPVAGTPEALRSVDLEASVRPDEPGPDRLQAPIDAFAPALRQGLFTVPRLAAMDGDSTAAGDDEP